MKKLNVLHLIGGLISGGAENMAVNLVNALRDDRFNVVLAARQDGVVSQKLKSNVGLCIISKNKVIDLNHLWGLIRLIRKNKIDIIHSHMFGANLYGFAAAKLTRTKIIQTAHGMDCLNTKQRIIAYRLMYKFVDKIVTVSESLRTEFIKATKINKDKVCTINNGIAIKKSYDKDAGIIKRQEMGLPVSCPVIGSVGNIKYVKGYDVLLYAAAKVIERCPEAKFIIVGETFDKHKHEKAKLDKLLESLDLNSNVHFLGYRSDVTEILPILDVFILPSRSEGLSLALLEAMACGKPILATNVGGNPSIVEDGISGVLIPSDNSAILADKIVTLLDNRELSEEFGRKARECVESKFSINQMAQKYENLYEEVVYR